MDPKAWAKELPADAREVLGAGLGVDAPAGTQQAVWNELAAKLPTLVTTTAAASGGLTGLSLVKTFGIGLVLGAVTVSGVAVVRHVTAPATAQAPPAAPTTTASPAAAAARPAEATPPNAASFPAVSGRSQAHGAAPTVTTAPSPAPDATVEISSPPSPGPSIAAFPSEPAPAAATPENAVLLESRRVARARSFLQGGHARSALAELDAIERAFPQGLLVQEREALRIEALLAAGERARARSEAERFLARYPRSPHAAAAERALR